MSTRKQIRKPRLRDLEASWWQLDSGCDTFSRAEEEELPVLLNYEYARSSRQMVLAVIANRFEVQYPVPPFARFLARHFPEFPGAAYVGISSDQRRRRLAKLGVVGENSGLLPPSAVRVETFDMMAALRGCEPPPGFPNRLEEYLMLHIDYESASDDEIRKQVERILDCYLEERNQAKNAQVAGAEQSWAILPSELHNLPAFLFKLRAAERPIDKMIVAKLPSARRRELKQSDGTEHPPTTLIAALEESLNKLLVEMPREWNENELEGIDLRPKTTGLLNKDEISPRLNRLVLEDAYRGFLTPIESVAGRNVRERRGQGVNRRTIAAALKQLGALRLLNEYGWREKNVIAVAPTKSSSSEPYYACENGKWSKPAKKALATLQELARQWCEFFYPQFHRPTVRDHDPGGARMLPHGMQELPNREDLLTKGELDLFGCASDVLDSVSVILQNRDRLEGAIAVPRLLGDLSDRCAVDRLLTFGVDRSRKDTILHWQEIQKWVSSVNNANQDGGAGIEAALDEGPKKLHVLLSKLNSFR